MTAPEFEALVRRMRPRMECVAARIMPVREDAQDITSEAIARAWPQCERILPAAQAECYMLRAARNTAIDAVRRVANQRTASLDTAVEGRDGFTAYEVPDSSQDPGAHIERLMGEEIARAIASLPPKYRAAVRLVDVEEYSYREASSALRIPMGTLRSRLYRGHNMLRERLCLFRG